MIFKRHITVIIFFSVCSAFGQDGVDHLQDHFEDEELRSKITRFIEQGYGKSMGVNLYSIDSVIKEAKSYLGVVHRMGGQTRQGIDCSGLVMMAHSREGISLPHSGNEQARYGTVILQADHLMRGDLVFFFGTYNTPDLVTHSGIYLGEGEFIHVSAKKGTIVSTLQQGYWAEHFLFATRLLDTH